MAIGADQAVLVETSLRPDQELQPLAVAKIFAKLVAKVRFWGFLCFFVGFFMFLSVFACFVGL